jgi:hypothetical protein
MVSKNMNHDRIGRAIIRLYHHAGTRPISQETVMLGAAIKAGRFMEFAERIRRRGSELSHDQIIIFANLVGLDESDLRLVALPTLKQVGVLDYFIVSGKISIDEYVGVSAPLLNQVASTWEALEPSVTERCALESIELATAAPLYEADHFAALEAMGFSSETRINALAALRAIGMIQRMQSSPSDEPIIYNEYVWGNGVVPIARFLTNLPTDERAMLTSVSTHLIKQPGLSLSQFQHVNPNLISAARKVGFLDMTRIVTGTGETLFAFSPTLERGLPINSTDVLHERKLFVAHILFGHRNTSYTTGRIQQPLVLVNALLQKGEVGPASAISSDYPLLESHGIVKVRQSSIKGRAYLSLVKRDVVEESLPLLEAALGDTAETTGSQSINSLWLPGSFRGPEADRRNLHAPTDAEAELFKGAIKRLREEARKVTGGER